MSEETACKKRKVDKFITNTYKLIQSLPEPLNTNQFIGVLLEDFLNWCDQRVHQDYVELDDVNGGYICTMTNYAFAEFLFLVYKDCIVPKLGFTIWYTEIQYLPNMSIEEFINLLRMPCTFLMVSDEEVEHLLIQWLSDEDLHMSLRFFETVILTVFLEEFYCEDCKFIDFTDGHYNKFIESVCNMCTTQNDNIFLTSQYYDRVRRVTDLLCQVFGEELVLVPERSELLNEVQNVLHTNPDVHPRVKHALHFCL